MSYTKEQKKEYRKKNKERLNAQARDLYWKKPDKARAAARSKYDLHPRELVDHVSKIFGDWLVLAEGYRNKFKQRTWVVQCMTCGKTTNHSTPNLHSLSVCKDCRGRPKGESGLTELYGQYKRNAEKNDREFTLTIKEFAALTSSHCHYCGIEPCMVLAGSSTDWSKYPYNGIDRKNNDMGYLPSNCVPCCDICNKAKRAMPYRDFLDYRRRMANHQALLDFSE